MKILDTLTSDPCPKCGCTGWIIDGNPPEKKYWLLCLGDNCGCVETKPIPENIIVEDD